MRTTVLSGWRPAALLATAGALVATLAATPPLLASPADAAIAPAAPAAAAALPDPLTQGPYAPETVQEAKLGLVALQEPNSAGAAPSAGTSQAPENLQIRGALYYPQDRTKPSPLLVLVHGNHGSCDAGQDSTTASCTAFKRNEAGYAYLGENLATWGYTTFSVSQDQLMMRQDSAKGKGMHQRRLLIAATLDALSEANQPGGLPVDANTTIGTTLVGRLDMTRIGLMGHSRGGDAVTSFIDYNRERTDGPRYPLRGVISLAPVDYERKAPYGTPYMSILPMCDGDVSNLQGARFFERSQYIKGDDPFPRIQVSHQGSIHNWYNTVWYADGGADGQGANDAACGNSAPFATNNVHPDNLRLSGSANPQAIVDAGDGRGSQDQSKTDNYVIDNRDTYDPEVNTKISGDPARMGDQEKLGLATMAAFFRRYVGGEGAFEPYMTGELSDTASHRQIPASACPTSPSGTRIGCEEYASTTYFAPPAERVDVIRPEIENPLGLNALGGTLSGSGFDYPYLDNGAVALPDRTPGGYDWCNPEPDDFAPGQLGKTTQPTGAKACPLPAKAGLGGQNATRENSPVNHSYGRQLALAWKSGQTAGLTAQIPAADRDVSGLKALAFDADVNFFDLRNPGADRRGDNTRVANTTECTAAAPCWPNEGPTSYDPASTSQDFLVAVRDTSGREATVHAGDPRWGNALQMSTGTNTPNTHIVLEQVRVPLTEFTAQGVDVSSLAAVELRFGEAGTPSSGSVQLADLRFQEAAVATPLVLSDGTAVDQGAGSGAPATGPDPADELEEHDVTPGDLALVDTVGEPGSATTWVVDDDRVQCPGATFTSIQRAVDFAAPWDTIVVCAGTYQERSTPVNHPSNPVATGALNGLTITKPLKIKGAGADQVTIMPDQSLATLAGATPYLRDGGGNVITVSRQSLGSTDTNEMFVDISGVTVTAGSTYAEAGIAFFGAAGRVSDSVVGPMEVGSTPAELAAAPHGWGIVKTSLVQGSGPGTVENEVTVADSVVTGYQAGGILFDGASGTDGAAANTVRTGTRQHGYVTRTVVRGTAGSPVSQTGVAWTSGTDGFLRGSRVTGNSGYGVRLTDARTEVAGALTVSASTITGNGTAVANQDAAGTAVRQGAPFAVSASFLGAGDVAAPDAGGSPSVVTSGRRYSDPVGVPTTVGAVTDSAPSAELVDPAPGTTVAVGQTIAPLVRGRDDHAVRSSSLLVDGAPVASAATAPYVFSWTPTAAYAGRTVRLQGVVTDSSGRTTTSAPVTVVVAASGTVPNPPAAGTLSVVDVDKQRRRGTATLTLAVDRAGTVKVSGSKVRSRTSAVASDLTATVKVKVDRKHRAVLRKRGKVRVVVTLTYTPTGGSPVSTTEKITLRLKRR